MESQILRGGRDVDDGDGVGPRTGSNYGLTKVLMSPRTNNMARGPDLVSGPGMAWAQDHACMASSETVRSC
jgi:hypothetical protein